MTAQEAFCFHCFHSFSCVPTTLYIPKHLTHHPSLRQCALTHNAAAHIHTHNDAETTNFYRTWQQGHFFHDWLTCSYISSFHQHQTSRKSASSLQQHRAKAFGVFLHGYKWVVRVSVHLLLLRVKSTAQGVIH